MHTSTCLLLRYVNGGSTSPNHFSVYMHTVSKGSYAFMQSVRGKELLASPLMQHVGSLFQEKQICRSSFQSAVVQREPPLDSGPHRTRDAPRPSATAHPFYPRKHVSEGSGTKKDPFLDKHTVLASTPGHTSGPVRGGQLAAVRSKPGPHIARDMQDDGCHPHSKPAHKHTLNISNPAQHE